MQLKILKIRLDNKNPQIPYLRPNNTPKKKIIEEVAASRVTERGGRADDKRSEAAMEDRKKEGYF